MGIPMEDSGMTAIYVNSRVDEASRRASLYEGQLFVLPPCPSSLALCGFARGLIQEAFGTADPRESQRRFAVEEYAAILADVKPRFIHHPQSKAYLQGILSEHGSDANKTYFDVPRLRSSTSDGYLTTGIAYAWHPHRDTWFSAPHCQLNWWMPVYDMQDNDGLAFHPEYWSEAVRNDSHIYNYYRWNKVHRAGAAQHLKQDTRPLPRPVQPIRIEPQIRPVCPAGSIIVFSAGQLHSTVPNTSGKTRFSIDFRTVNIDDVASQRGLRTWIRPALARRSAISSAPPTSRAYQTRSWRCITTGRKVPAI